MPERAKPAPTTKPPATAGADEVLRFRSSERWMHWAIAVPFLICYTTALILVLVYNPNPARPLRGIVSWIHRVSGVCLALLPLWAVVRHRADMAVHVSNVKEAWIWKVADVKWLFLMGPAAFNRNIVLPHQGKFNAAEKINFMVLTAVYPLLILTGLVIWLPGAAYVSWLLHVSMAVLVTPLMLGHIFMATINPETRVGLTGMISGFVDRHWAKHHYRRWYDEQYGACEPPPDVAPVVESPDAGDEAARDGRPDQDESVAA